MVYKCTFRTIIIVLFTSFNYKYYDRRITLSIYHDSDSYLNDHQNLQVRAKALKEPMRRQLYNNRSLSQSAD